MGSESQPCQSELDITNCVSVETVNLVDGTGIIDLERLLISIIFRIYSAKKLTEMVYTPVTLDRRMLKYMAVPNGHCDTTM